MWKVTLKDGRKVRLRFLTADDKEKLFRMFSSMSEKALEWSMAPYTMDNVERWISNLPTLIALVKKPAIQRRPQTVQRVELKWMIWSKLQIRV